MSALIPGREHKGTSFLTEVTGISPSKWGQAGNACLSPRPRGRGWSLPPLSAYVKEQGLAWPPCTSTQGQEMESGSRIRLVLDQISPVPLKRTCFYSPTMRNGLGIESSPGWWC